MTTAKHQAMAPKVWRQPSRTSGQIWRMFDVKPGLGPLPLRFGMTEGEVSSALGQPLSRSKNRRKEPDWDYGDFSVRFGAQGEGVVEVGFLPESSITLFGIALFADKDAFDKVLNFADDIHEDMGFVVIPSLGMTFTGFHDADENNKAVTAFALGRWDGRRSKFELFQKAKWRR